MPAPTVAPMTPPITAPMMGDATVARGTAMTLSNGTATMQSTLPTTVGDVAAAQVDGSNPSVSGAGGASQTYRLGYLGTKRYLRVVATVSGTTTGAV